MVINDWAMVDLVKSREYLFSFFKQAEVQSLYSWIIKLLPDKSGPCVEGKLRSVTAIHLTHYFYRTNLNKTQHEVPSDQWEKQISSLFIIGKRRTHSDLFVWWGRWMIHFDLFVVGRRMTHSGIPVWLLRDWTRTSYRQSVARGIIWWGTWKWRKPSLEVRNTKDFNDSQS